MTSRALEYIPTFWMMIVFFYQLDAQILYFDIFIFIIY